MTINPNLVQTGTAAGIGAIMTDVSAGLGSAVPVQVHLSTPYTLACPPGWPNRPGLTGKGPGSQNYPGSVLASGTTIAFVKAEADALVLAGAGSYA